MKANFDRESNQSDEPSTDQKNRKNKEHVAHTYFKTELEIIEPTTEARDHCQFFIAGRGLDHICTGEVIGQTKKSEIISMIIH